MKTQFAYDAIRSGEKRNTLFHDLLFKLPLPVRYKKLKNWQ